jgi:hypothetical protein
LEGVGGRYPQPTYSGYVRIGMLLERVAYRMLLETGEEAVTG